MKFTQKHAHKQASGFFFCYRRKWKCPKFNYIICIHFPTYFSSTVNWLLLRNQIFLVRHYNIPRTPVPFPPPHLFPFYDISHARGEGKSPSHKSVQITPRSPSARFFLFIRTLHGGAAGSRVAGSSCNGTEDATMCGHFLQLIFEPLEGLGRRGGGLSKSVDRRTTDAPSSMDKIILNLSSECIFEYEDMHYGLLNC